MNVTDIVPNSITASCVVRKTSMKWLLLTAAESQFTSSNAAALPDAGHSC